jgi:hypothetical protein
LASCCARAGHTRPRRPRRRRLLRSRRTPSRTEAAPPRSSARAGLAQLRRCVCCDGSRWSRPRRRRSRLCAGPPWREPAPRMPSGRCVDCIAARFRLSGGSLAPLARRPSRGRQPRRPRARPPPRGLTRAGMGGTTPAASSHTPPPAPRTPFGRCVDSPRARSPAARWRREDSLPQPWEPALCTPSGRRKILALFH